MEQYVVLNILHNYVLDIENNEYSACNKVEERLRGYFEYASEEELEKDVANIMAGNSENGMVALRTYEPEVAVGSIVQIIPEHDWGGTLVIVDEVKSFGVQAYVTIPHQGTAYIRLKHDEFELVGAKAPFVIE